MATQFVTVSIEIMHDKNLTANEKFILAEIQQLEQLDRGCIASNQHFADLLGIARPNASRVITSLKDKGYITTEIVKGSRNRERIIRSIKMIKGCYQNDNEVVSKRQETKENRTINKTINTYDIFIDELKSKVKIKSKVTKTKDGKKLFNAIKDKDKLIESYIKHQEEKKDFAQRITAFMEDYQEDDKGGTMMHERTLGGYTF